MENGISTLLFRRAVVASAVALCLVSAAACDRSADEGGAAAAPSESVTLPTCGDTAQTRSAVSYRNETGATLTGYVLGTGATGVVLAAQAGDDACSWLAYARKLAERGYRVLAGNFVGEGGSTYITGGKPSGDVAAAARYLRSAGVANLVLIGASRGGTAAIVAGGLLTPPVAGVISLSSPEAYAGESALGAAPKLMVPVLYVVAADDAPFNTAAESLYKATGEQRRKLVTVPGGFHGEGLLLSGATGTAETTAAVDEFLAAYAPPA